MAAGEAGLTARFELRGVTVEATIVGSGRNILFLSAGLWIAPDHGFASELAGLGQVIAPRHPGYATGEPPRHLSNADDLAYVYLDMLDHLKAQDTLVVAGSFGGFVAAQMAVKDCARIAGLVLIDPLGLRPGKREERDYADVFATDEPDLLRLAFADPTMFEVNAREIPEPGLAERVRAREALSRYVWQPYMHDPRLVHKLHRITVPTLVLWGEADRVSRQACAEAYVKGVAGARLQVVAEAGHLPHVEQTGAVVAAIEAFTKELAGAPSGRPATAKGVR